MVERRRLRFLLALGRRRLGAGTTAGRRRGHLAAEQPQRFGARLLEVHARVRQDLRGDPFLLDRKSTRLNSSHGYISYAVFCLKKKKISICYSLPYRTRV